MEIFYLSMMNAVVGYNYRLAHGPPLTGPEHCLYMRACQCLEVYVEMLSRNMNAHLDDAKRKDEE